MAVEYVDGAGVLGSIEKQLPDAKAIRIATPFLTISGARLLLNVLSASSTRVRKQLELLVRFDARSIGSGVCEPGALASLLSDLPENCQLSMRFLESLHAKTITLMHGHDRRVDVVGSANFTYAGLTEYGNEEACLVARDETGFQNGMDLDWNRWWKSAKKITKVQIKEWQSDLPRLRQLFGGGDPPPVRACLVLDGQQDYVRSLIWILRKAARQKGLSIKDLHSNLDHDPDHDVSAENLAKFVGYLGLVVQARGRLYVTDLGRQIDVEKKKGNYRTLFALLADHYEEVPAFYGAMERSSYHSYKEVVARLAGPSIRKRFLSGKKLDYSVLSPVKKWLHGMKMVEERLRPGSVKEFRWRT